MFGAKINSIRLARGYSQDYISKKLGISQKEYSKIERNEKIKLDEVLLDKIANSLGVSVDDIKSPTPIVMSFNNNPFSGKYNQDPTINESIIAELTNQLNVKYEQIEKLMAQNLQLIMQIGKGNITYE